MNRAKRLYVLLGVLVVLCAATFLVFRLEERKEQIQTSGEVVLEIDADAVQTLAWEYDGQSLSFHRDEDGWLYDDDEAFPVDSEKIAELLEEFQAFSAAFIITDVEDFGQYGLDDPECTITLTTQDTSYEILLGDYSTMDAQRYVSTGDGNVYLAVSDPLDVYDVELSDLILQDQVPDWTQVTGITFSGTENYSVFYSEDSTDSYCAEDVYFTQQDGENLPLDTSLVESYLNRIRSLSLTDYVTYNATDEELQTYGLDDPELSITIDYTYETQDGETLSDTFVLHISRDAQQRAAGQEESDDEEEDEEILAYARVDGSSILYQISSSVYTALMAASYDDLRHPEVFTADFAQVTQIDISLEGTDYTITSQEEDDTRTYYYQDTEPDLSDFQSALEALEANSFTDEQPTGQQEISLTLYLDNENFSQLQIQLYRYNGTECLAVVDGKPVSLIPRSQAVDLMEAVLAIVLN